MAGFLDILDFLGQFEADGGILPDSMADLTQDEVIAVVASAKHRNSPMLALQALMESTSLGPREASALMLRSDIDKASCELVRLLTNDWDDMARALRAPTFRVIVDLLNSPKDHTRIEGARLAARLVEVQAKEERKEMAARRQQDQARAMIEKRAKLEHLTDEELAANITARTAALH